MDRRVLVTHSHFQSDGHSVDRGRRQFSCWCRYLRRPEWFRRWLGCPDDFGGGAAERFKRSEQLVDAADRNDRNGEAFLVEMEIDRTDLGTFGEAKLDHERLAAFALQFSAKNRSGPRQLAALVSVKNPTYDELRRAGDGDRIVKCHRPRRVTHHQVERKIAIVEIAPAFYCHRDVAVGYCVREKWNVWAHQLPRLTIDLLAATRRAAWCSTPVAGVLCSSAPLSSNRDLVILGQRSLKFIIEKPHRIKNFTESGRFLCSVSLSKSEDAIVSQISHDPRIVNSIVDQVA